MKEISLKDILEKKIRIEPKVKSIYSLFYNEDRVKNTNYSPSYQRNYVWDDEKATYFIESIFLGTEIPPIILFETEESYEVIDGRQRYQTILNFLRNKLRLRKSGLQKLGSVEGFVGHCYKDLNPKYQVLFTNTKIRLIEFSFFSEDYTKEEEDIVKKEIFKRYNTGITPLKKIEIDKAVYLDNDLNTFFKENIQKDKEVNEALRKYYRFDKAKIEDIQKEVRMLLVLNQIPIKYYANRKQDVVKRFFEFYSDRLDNSQYGLVYGVFREILIGVLSKVWNEILKEDDTYNKLFSECLFWGLSIIYKEQQNVEINESDILAMASFYSENKKYFLSKTSSFYGDVYERYKATADFFSSKFNINYNLYLDTNPVFQKKNKETLNTSESTDGITLEELRINKPEPTSEEVEDICRQMRESHYLMRPPYQRDEVIDRKKSSAIIESLLLGLRLPPIFVFNKDGINKEVVDGQQRLLSILGFLGEPYRDERGLVCRSNKDQFALNLKDGILKEYDGKHFYELDKKDQRRIKRSELWIVEINGEINQRFDPVDLFVRLNNKPYPIKSDTFEMWNSYITRDIIDTVKTIAKNNHNWFYLRKSDARMDDENILTSLAYLTYKEIFTGSKSSNLYDYKELDIYKTNKINCRLKGKHEITKILEQGDAKNFVYAINLMDFDFISTLRKLCSPSGKPEASDFNNLFAYENKSGKRVQQNYYVLWIILHGLVIPKDCQIKVVIEIRKILESMRNEKLSVPEWKSKIMTFRSKFQHISQSCLYARLSWIAEVKKDLSDGEESLIEIDETDGIRFLTNKTILNRSNNLSYYNVHIVKLRAGFDIKYISAILASRYAFLKLSGALRLDRLKELKIPFVKDNVQDVFSNVYDYMCSKECNQSMRMFFSRINDIMTQQLFMPKQFEEAKIDMIGQMRSIPKLGKDINIEEIYKNYSSPSSTVAAFMVSAINISEDYNEKDYQD